MNYTQLITEVQKVALKQHNVNSFSSNDVYDEWNKPHTQYASVNIGLESADRTENTIIYNCVLYYGDRLLQNASNKIAIQDDAVKVLQGIISNLSDEITYYTPINYTVFEQEFADYIAGAYCRVRLETEFDQGNCSLDDYIEELKTLYVTENGIFNVAGYDQVEVHVEGGTVEGITEEECREIVEGYNYATKDEIPSLDGYATEQWVNNQGFIKSGDIPELTGYAKIVDVDASLAKKQDNISDLDVIRSGAALGATAIQEHQPLKTINGESIVGTGNIEIESGSSVYVIDATQDIGDGKTGFYITQEVIDHLNDDSNPVYMKVKFTYISGTKTYEYTTLLLKKLGAAPIVVAEDGKLRGNEFPPFVTVWNPGNNYFFYLISFDTSLFSKKIDDGVSVNITVDDSTDSAFRNLSGLESRFPTRTEVTAAVVELRNKDAEIEAKIPSLDGYATKQYVQDQIIEAGSVTIEQVDTEIENKLSTKNYATKDEIPSLTGYATQQWVNNQHFLTEHQSLAEYLKITDAANTYATKDDIAGLGLKMEIVFKLPEVGDRKTIYLLGKEDELETDNWYDEYVFIEGVPGIVDNHWEKIGNTKVDLTDYAKKSDIPSLSGYATTTYVNTELSKKQDAGDYATKQYVQDQIAEAGGVTIELVDTEIETKLSTKNYATKDEIPSIEGLATTTYVNTELAKKQDAGDYALRSELPVVPSLDPYAKITDVNSSLGKKQDTISDLATIRSGAALGATAIQEHQSLKTINNLSIVGTGNITIQGGGNVISLTQAEYDALAVKDPNTLYNITDGSPVATEEYVNTGLSTKQDIIPDLADIRSGAAKGWSAIQSLDGYATETFVTSQGYLTSAIFSYNATTKTLNITI